MEQIEDFICNFCGKVCKNANSLRNHERLCKLNPQRQLTTYEKYGAIPGFNSAGCTPWNKGQTAATNASIAKISKTLHSRYEAGEIVAYQPMNDPEVRAKHKASMKKAYSNYTKRTPGKFKYGWYNGVWCDSSWELAYLLYCQNNNINVVRNTLGFSYFWQGSVHKYFPDFYLPDEGVYIEIKGHKTERDEAKIAQFAEKLLVLESLEMKPILKEVETVFGKQFTALYDQNNMVP